jgi:hypothetical protein
MKVWARFLLSTAAAIATLATLGHAQSQCPALSDPCMNESNAARCKKLDSNGCKMINILESCPLQFSCADFAPAPSRLVRGPIARFPSAPAPARPVARAPTRVRSPPTRWIVRAPTRTPPPPACPAKTAPCMNEENFAQCQGLVKAGCKQPYGRIRPLGVTRFSRYVQIPRRARSTSSTPSVVLRSVVSILLFTGLEVSVKYTQPVLD